MPIKQSVGRHGTNHRADVRLVQILMNLNAHRFSTPAVPTPGRPMGMADSLAARAGITPAMLGPVAEDGSSGPGTIARIEAFQRHFGDAMPTGLIKPGDAILTQLRDGMPTTLTLDVMSALVPGAARAKVERYYKPLIDGMASYTIDTPLRRAHFLAQLAHESADFVYSEEIASGAAYEGRKDLGNTETGDGTRFKGRGLIQITGRANYKAYGDYCNKDYVTNDGWLQLARDANVAVDCSCWYWGVKAKINPKADADDVIAVTKAINGGSNGLADRKERLARIKFLLRVT